MTGPQPPRSCLARVMPQQSTSPDEMREMRRSVWLQQGIAVLPLVDLPDDWARQVVINEANRLYGPRRQAK